MVKVQTSELWTSKSGVEWRHLKMICRDANSPLKKLSSRPLHKETIKKQIKERMRKTK